MKKELIPIKKIRSWEKIVLKMKLTLTLFLFGLVSVSASTYAQNTKLDISLKNNSIIELFKEIEQNSEFYFFYKKEELKDVKNISVDFKNATVMEILDQAIAGKDLEYKVIDRYVVVRQKGQNMSIDEIVQQQKSITGTVTDESGQPLPGVTIVIKGTTQGIVTNADGDYTITNLPDNATLVFSFVGMRTQEIEIGNQTTINATMIEETFGIEEVVAIGYGTKRKRDITSAVSIVDMEDIGDIPASNVSRLLQGQAAGVVVKQNSGTPGEEMDVVIRGISSLGAGSAPLYVVDGFAVGTSAGKNLNPNDIESISILKDAASTAIYGARGSNGVILISTKSAKEGELSLTVYANYGIQNVPNSRKTIMMNGIEFAQFKNDSFVDKIRYFEQREPSVDEIPLDYRYPEQTKYSTNWYEEISNNNASFQNYNVTLASGKGKIKSLVSLGYLGQEGAVIKTNFDRFNVRANVTGDVNDFISMGWNVVGSRSNERYVSSFGRSNIIGKSLWADPRDPVYNEDGSFNAYISGHDGVFGSTNPVMQLHEEKNMRYVTNLTTNGYIAVSFLKNFKFKSAINASLLNTRNNEFRPSSLPGNGFNQPPPKDAVLRERYAERINTSADQLLTYTKVLGNHNFDAMLGYTAQEETYRDLYARGKKFANDEVRFMQNAELIESATSNEVSWSLLAYFARLNYDYKGKYLVSASYRREGSSRFGEENKWGNFPAVSAGWRLSEESFIPETSWMNDLKIRGSYGLTGNNNIGDYNNSTSLVATGYILGGQYAPGQRLNSFVNTKIGWEESKQLDIGLDLTAFDNKLVFTAEFYNKVTNNMLLPVDIPIITGFNKTLTNVGKVENKGIEFAVNYKTKVTKDLNIRGNFNISFNKNKVLEINGENDELWTGSFYGVYNRSVVGRPIGMLTGYKMIGIFNTDEEIANSPTQDGAIPGVYKYWDANGDGVISYDREDMVEVGNPHPAFVWALTLGADYKRFDFNVLFTGAQNYDIMRDIEKTTMNMDGVFNILQSGVNRWRSAENPGDGRGATSNTWKWERESNSRYVYDASHAWVKTVTVGYSIPATKSILGGTRFYVNADNLFLITNYPGNNPDINGSGDGRSPGRDDQAYPVPRTFSLGANIKF